jgi:hypothetical protein
MSSTTNCGILKLDYYLLFSTTDKRKVWLCPTFRARSLWSFWTISDFFHSTQHKRTWGAHISCKKNCRARKPPAEIVNWTKWSDRLWEFTIEKSIRDRTNAQKEPKVLQEINKCWPDSMPSHPETHRWASSEIMPRVTKSVFVGNLSRKRRQTNMKTFKGICLCHTRSSATSKVT